MEPHLSGRRSSGRLGLPGRCYSKPAILLLRTRHDCLVRSVKMASRKQRVIMLEQKLKIVDDLKEGKSQRLVGDIHVVPKSTVGDIWKDRGKIEKYVSTSD